MKARYHSAPFVVFVLTVLVSLMGCDLIIGRGEQANVTIDLDGLFSSDRSIRPPTGTSFTSLVVTVFGPGMSPMTKTVTKTARYLTLAVPSGPDRHFKLEAFFDITDPGVYVFHHLRSYIGRARVDLKPGVYVKLLFNMAAGSSYYLVPDYYDGVIYYSPDMLTFNVDWQTVLGAGGGIGPMDVELSAKGSIYAANYSTGSTVINFADNWDGLNTGTIPTGAGVFALAMDRNADYNINYDKVDDTSVLYFSTSASQLYFTVVDTVPTAPQLMYVPPELTSIFGLSVDPWTHLLYIAGVHDGAMALISYDPFYRVLNGTNWDYGRILDVKKYSSLFTLPVDVMVTDQAIFVLNLNPPTTADPKPSILQFDFNLNFVRGFGSVSGDAADFIASTAPGKFYYPLRFIAHENEGLSIIDDSSLTDASGDADFDKLIHINKDLDPGSWWTYPAVQTDGGFAGEFFRFLY